MATTKNIVEYGHYYKTQGPTLGTIQSISVFNTLQAQGFFGDDLFTLLFIDDVHTKNPHEINGDIQVRSIEGIQFDMTVLESRTKIVACQLINSLQHDPEITIIEEGSKKYLIGGKKQKIELLDTKNPSCVMMDAALTLLKMSGKTGKGNKKIINILPMSYKRQQENLHNVITTLFRIGKIKEPIRLQSILFNSDLTGYELLETMHISAQKNHFNL